MDEQLTEEQLIRAAARQGCNVTKHQLKRWRRAQLIPRPLQVHTGGHRGSHSSYPAGTLTQLLAVCELHERFRKLDRIRFELWLTGRYAGDLDPVRTFLIGRLEGMVEPVRAHRDRFDDPFKAADAAIRDLTFTSRNPALRAMRRFARREEAFQSAAHALLVDLFGGEVDWEFDTGTALEALIEVAGPDAVSDVEEVEFEQSLRTLIDRATGVERAKSDPLLSGEPLLPPNASIVENLQAARLHRVLDLDDPGWAILAASDVELEAARIQARLIAQGFTAIAHIVAASYSRDHAGLSLFGAVDPTDPTLAAVCVQLGLLLRLDRHN